MNILGGLDLPSAGQCRVAGHTLTRLGDRERDEYRRFVVGHVWQQSGRNLVPDLTLIENVGLPQMLAGVGPRQRRERGMALLSRVGLSALARKRPHQLSGGEQQRGAIAVALANEPELVLADEPTGELDSVTAGGIVGLVHGLTRALGLTVVLVTHDPAVAAAADRTILIRDGRTSTETVRRDQPLAAAGAELTTAAGLPADTHRESVLVDRTGWVQLPDGILRALPFDGRAELRIALDHVELCPVGARSATLGQAGPGVTGLPADAYREAIVIDRVGRFQLPEAALMRIPFGRHAAVWVAGDCVELWPSGAGE
jgi:ABC-type lipoprotein export system ATPase subunit